jgi:hypothetical protein
VSAFGFPRFESLRGHYSEDSGDTLRNVCESLRTLLQEVMIGFIANVLTEVVMGVLAGITSIVLTNTIAVLAMFIATLALVVMRGSGPPPVFATR